MKAFVLHDVMNWSVDDVPTPSAPAGGMLVKVHACGLCGSDLRTIRSGHKNVTLPWTLGHEICGEVAELGEGFSGPWKIGRRLSIGPNVYDPNDRYCVEGRHELSANVREIGQQWPGALAEYVAIPRESVAMGNILAAPQHLECEYAAVVEPGSSVIHAHERARTTIGDTVLIMGSGPIGCLHVAIARACGADKIFMSDIVAKRLELAQAFEPDAVIDASKEDVAARVAELTDGVGPTIVITANPSPQAPVEAARMVAKGGRVVLFGGLPHDNSAPGVDLNVVHYQNLDLIGLSRFAPRHFRMSLQMLASGRIPGDKLVTHVLPLDKADEGINAALEGEALKVVFKP
jgi:L-iditol 2-dehydrogenase